MEDRAKFTVLPKETALFPAEVAPRQRSFLPPKGEQMGKPPRPIDLPPPKDEPLLIDKFLPKED